MAPALDGSGAPWRLASIRQDHGAALQGRLRGWPVVLSTWLTWPDRAIARHDHWLVRFARSEACALFLFLWLDSQIYLAVATTREGAAAGCGAVARSRVNVIAAI